MSLQARMDGGQVRRAHGLQIKNELKIKSFTGRILSADWFDHFCCIVRRARAVAILIVKMITVKINTSVCPRQVMQEEI